MGKLGANMITGPARDAAIDVSVLQLRPAPHADPERAVIAVIDQRTLDRECLVRTLSSSSPDRVAVGFESIDALLQAEGDLPWIILYRAGPSAASGTEAAERLSHLVKEAEPVPVMVIGDSEDVGEMIEAFDNGARGYLPSSVGLDTIVEATRMSLAKGVFLPLTSLQALRGAFAGGTRANASQVGQFTERQLAVCQALRRGKSNKMIAYELNLCESTVKVHIRTIMKKLRASNRTEAAFKLNTICFSEA